MSSLKKMIDNKIQDWGIDVLLISASKFVKCKCFDYSANEGDINCKICFGRGYVSGIKKVRAIIDFDSPSTRMNKYSNSRIGKRISDSYIIYFKSDVSAQEGDMLLIVGWNNKKIMDVYDKMREMKKHGKTENIPDGITDWWRLEFQFRGGKVEKWQEEVVEKMQSFHVLTLDDNDDISEIDKAVIERVNSDKFNFKKVSKDYATKIRKMVRENVGFDTTVSEFSLKAFNEQKEELQKQLDNMLAKYNIGEQTAEMTAYFEQQLNQTSNIDLSVVESGSVLERNVVRSISKHWQESK